MKIDTATCPYPLSRGFIAIIEEEIEKGRIPEGKSVTLNFRDPEYSAERGGFHPVEISISPKGKILYVTDFSYAGLAPFAELVKEIDFDFGLGLFQHFGREFPIARGKELFTLWSENFVSYCRMGVFEVTAEAD